MSEQSGTSLVGQNIISTCFNMLKVMPELKVSKQNQFQKAARFSSIHMNDSSILLFYNTFNVKKNSFSKFHLYLTFSISKCMDLIIDVCVICSLSISQSFSLSLYVCLFIIILCNIVIIAFIYLPTLVYIFTRHLKFEQLSQFVRFLTNLFTVLLSIRYSLLSSIICFISSLLFQSKHQVASANSGHSSRRSAILPKL